MYRFALLLLTVAVAHASVSVTRTSDDGRHPSEMEIEVQLPNSDRKVRIPLSRTDAFEDIPITMLDNGVSSTFSSSQVHDDSHAHYRNVDSRSVISVREANGKRQISGHVMHDGTSYFLEPVGESEHKVTKNVRTAEVMDKQIDLGKVRMMQSRRKRQTDSSSTTYTVELHLLLDYSVYSAMKSLQNGDDRKTMTELHYYYTHILNGIDTAYRNIGSLSISVKCIAITVAKSPYDNPWMPGSLDGSAILQALASYANGKTADHFMAFTRQDITGGGSSGVCGMAYLSGVCNSRRVSINEDQGLQSWGTAAHELGHNLGSQHDGAGNACNPNSKNLMAPSTSIYSVSDVANSYQFSACTVANIRTYINGLGASSCLRTSQGNRIPKLSENVREGARLKLDDVCKLAFPKSMGKFMLTSDTAANPAQICASIYCQMSAGSGSTAGGLRAPVGTTCGDRKSCNWKGQCTSDSQARPVNMACFWGDRSTFCDRYKSQITASVGARNYYCPRVKAECCKTLETDCP